MELRTRRPRCRGVKKACIAGELVFAGGGDRREETGSIDAFSVSEFMVRELRKRERYSRDVFCGRGG